MPPMPGSDHRRCHGPEKHRNSFNTGAATATDIEALGEEVRRRVLETSGVELGEIRRIGVHSTDGDSE